MNLEPHSIICHSTAVSKYHSASCAIYQMPPYLRNEIEVAREVYVVHLQHL